MSIEKIKLSALNISKHKDVTDINHIKNYCGKAFGFYPERNQIVGALEEINCFMITSKKIDLTGVENPLHTKEVSIKENSFIYFIGNLKEEICKIGTSVEPEKRLNEIQTGCPYKLSILKTVKGGGIENERIYHNRFEMYYMRGEWFRITGKLKEFLMY